MQLFMTVICILVCQLLSAQTGQPLHFEKIKGLSQNTVYSVMRDNQGFTWIATADGLNRFDGVEMKIYKPLPQAQAGSLKGRVIRTGILQDDQDKLWFSSDITLFQFDRKGEIFRDFNFGDSNHINIKGLSAYPLFQQENQIWFANPSFGTIEFNRKSGIYRVYSLPKQNGKKEIYIQAGGVFDNKERIWFASNNGLYSFNIHSHLWEQHLGSTSFYRIAISADTIYLSSEGNLVFFDINNSKSGTIRVNRNKEKAETRILALYTDSDKNIWAGDEKGNVYCKRNFAGYFDWLGNINNAETGEIKYPVYCFYRDENKILWVGSDVLGLMRANTYYSGFNSFPAPNDEFKKQDYFVTAIYEDEYDKIWLGIYTKGLMLLDKKNRTVSSVPMPGVSINNENKKLSYLIKKDSDNNLWIGYERFLFVKENGKKEFKRLMIPGLLGDHHSSLSATAISKFNNIWILGTTSGLFIIEKKGDQFIITEQNQIGKSSISAVWNNNNSEVWVAFESTGFLKAKKDLVFNTSDMQFDKLGVKSFLYDSTHGINWISTLSGLIAYHLKSGKYRLYKEDDGLKNSYVYGSLQNKDQLWLSTNNGLYSAKISWQQNKVIPDLAFSNYTSSDGLPDNEFNTGAFHLGNKGTFYFGTVRGLTWFDPSKVESNPFRPVNILLEIKVNDKKVDSAILPESVSKLSLSHSQNNLYFRFRGIEYLDPLNVTYAYKMEGLESDWVNNGTFNEIRYNSIPPGHYTFRIKAANGSGLWSEKDIRVELIIFAPFWNTLVVLQSYFPGSGGLYCCDYKIYFPEPFKRKDTRPGKEKCHRGRTKSYQ